MPGPILLTTRRLPPDYDDIIRRLSALLSEDFPKYGVMTDSVLNNVLAVSAAYAVIAVVTEQDYPGSALLASKGVRSSAKVQRPDIEEALRLRKPLFSVWLGSVASEPAEQLPRPLRALVQRPYFHLTPHNFGRQSRQLVDLLKSLMDYPERDEQGDTLEIPSQGYGPHFEIDENGVIKFAPPGALDQQGNNVDRLRRMHPTLRELSANLVGALDGGNVPHNHLLDRSRAYDKLVGQSLEAIDFALLYMEGVRLANAEKAAAGDKELPPLDAPVRETLDSLLQIHGSFILASREGLESYEAEQRYQRNQKQEAEYREAAVEFASSLQGQPDSVDPAVAAAAMSAAEEIGKGVNPERSGAAATGLMRNLTVTFSVAAAVGTVSAGAIASGSVVAIALAGAAALVATEGLKKSKPFAALSALVTQGIDKTETVEPPALQTLGQRFKKHLSLFRATEGPLSRLAANREDFEWLRQTIGWIEGRISSKSAHAEPPELPPVEQPAPEPEHSNERVIAGNIYLAKISKVEAALESATVDFGGWEYGVLSFRDIHPDYYQIPVRDRQRLLEAPSSPVTDRVLDRYPPTAPLLFREEEVSHEAARAAPAARPYKMQDVIKRRQVMLVQALSNETDGRSAMLTTFLSLQGRYFALAPNSSFGVRITHGMFDSAERSRLAEIAQEIEVPEGMGLLLLPPAIGAAESELLEDYEWLIRTWETVRDQTLRSVAPTLVFDATEPIVSLAEGDEA